jgi:hypothetical protein
MELLKKAIIIGLFFMAVTPAWAGYCVTGNQAKPNPVVVDGTAKVMTLTIDNSDYGGVNAVQVATGGWPLQAMWSNHSDWVLLSGNKIGGGQYGTAVVYLRLIPTTTTQVFGVHLWNSGGSGDCPMGANYGTEMSYGINPAVSTSATELLSSLTAGVFRIIPIAIGIVGGLIATLFGLRWLIRFARRNIHG